MCADFLPEHDGAITLTIRQLLLFMKVWGNGKINIYINIVGSGIVLDSILNTKLESNSLLDNVIHFLI